MQVVLFYIVKAYMSCYMPLLLQYVKYAFDTENFYIAFPLSRHGNM